jgi:hypothetical protein
MEELKFCPHCGNTTAIACLNSNEIEYLLSGDNGYSASPYYAVVCSVNEYSQIPSSDWQTGCGASGGYAPTKEEAIEKWNERYNEVVSNE